MTEEQLLLHAARCASLAEACLDRTVARKLQALAQDYRDFARRATDLREFRLGDCPPLVPVAEPRKNKAAG
jgi:hypothetical protein